VKVLFIQAIRQTILEHPLLRVVLIGEDSKRPGWAGLKEIDIRWLVSWIEVESPHDLTHHYQTTIPSHLDSRFPDLENRPGWKVTLLHDPHNQHIEVIFAWNHANFDGVSGKIFHETLLRHLNHPAPSETSDETFISGEVDTNTFPPPQEHWAKYPITPTYLLSSAWKEFRPRLLTPKTTANTKATWAPLRTTPFETRVRGFSVDHHSLTKLLHKCREHNTTLTGLLNAVVLFSLSSQLDEQTAPAFAGGTALDTRRFSSPINSLIPENTMANFVSAVEHHFTVAEMKEIRKVLGGGSSGVPHTQEVQGMVWKIASRVREEIQARLDKGTRNDIVGLMRVVTDWRGTVKSQTRKPRSLSWNVSNIGVLDGGGLSEEGSGDAVWRCGRAAFVMGGEVAGAAVNVGAVSVKGKGLEVSVSWQDCAVEVGVGEQLVKDLESWLRWMSEGGSSVHDEAAEV